MKEVINEIFVMWGLINPPPGVGTGWTEGEAAAPNQRPESGDEDQSEATWRHDVMLVLRPE